MSPAIARAITAAFGTFLIAGPLAQAACDQTCAAAKTILGDSGNEFRNIGAGYGPPRYQCKPLAGSYACRIHQASKRVAEAAFQSSLKGFQMHRPGWKWFKATNARYQGREEIQIYGGPSRGHYFVDMWIARRGKHSTTDFSVASKEWNTTYSVVPCRGTCLSP